MFSYTRVNAFRRIHNFCILVPHIVVQFCKEGCEGGWDGGGSGVGDTGKSPVGKMIIYKPVSCSFIHVFIQQIFLVSTYLCQLNARYSPRCWGISCEYKISALTLLIF